MDDIESKDAYSKLPTEETGRKDPELFSISERFLIISSTGLFYLPIIMTAFIKKLEPLFHDDDNSRWFNIRTEVKRHVTVLFKNFIDATLWGPWTA